MNEDTTDDNVSYQTLPRDLYTVAATDVARDLIASAGNKDDNFNTALLEACWTYLTQAQLEQLAEMGYDEFHWEYTLHGNGSLHADPCVRCKTGNAFEVELVHTRTYTRLDDEPDNEYSIGAVHTQDVQRIVCGECGKVLEDTQ